MNKLVEQTIEEYKESFSKETFIFNVIVSGLATIKDLKNKKSDRKTINEAKSLLKEFITELTKLNKTSKKHVGNVLFTLGENVLKQYNL